MMIFDLHGTLVSFEIDYDRLRKELGANFNSDFTRIMESISKLGENDRKAAFAMLDDFELNSLDTLKIKDHARNVLEKARKKDYIICLVTLQGKKPTSEIMKRLEISNKFDYVVTRDDVVPRLEQISRCLKKFNVLGQDTLVIGDKAHDYHSASTLQCKAYLVRREGGIPFMSLGELQEII
ncbi:MAG: HAD family phosphatase [Nitrososphaera sp.]|nr:HAD family phosphatase [Nitrososphaera sp.]